MKVGNVVTIKTPSKVFHGKQGSVVSLSDHHVSVKLPEFDNLHFRFLPKNVQENWYLESKSPYMGMSSVELCSNRTGERLTLVGRGSLIDSILDHLNSRYS